MSDLKIEIVPAGENRNLPLFEEVDRLTEQAWRRDEKLSAITDTIHVDQWVHPAILAKCYGRVLD